jgi:hypothetical protein
LICNKDFFGFHTSKYCSKNCRHQAHFEQDKRWKQKQKKKERFCLICNNILLKNQKKFCCGECKKMYNKYNKKIKIEFKHCKICNKLFLSRSKMNIFCKSLSCQKEVLKIMRKRYHEKKKIKNLNIEKKCIICEKLFKPKNLHYKYCSFDCRKKRNYKVEHQKIKVKYYKDINYRLSVLLRTRFKRAIKNNSKKESAIKIIGCSIEDLKKYLENQFKPGMSWENYGFKTWHIDHIIPCFKFDLSKIKEQRKCFHYTNLRPLWAKENLTRDDY